MNDQQFKALIEASDVFKAFPKFKQDLTLRRDNLNSLKDHHHNAETFGIEYLKQNPNLTKSSVELIESIL